MAEQEITYIPYGLDEISQQDLMTNLANGVSGYLDSKRWAKKDRYRQAWLAAYQDIMNHGLAGASNDTGIWTINHRQDPIDLDAKSTLDREMYQDAAYYIQLQMSRMTPRKKEEEKKEKLDTFDFYTDFNKHLLKGYGNDLTIFADSEQGWDAQDARGANGLRETTKRRAAMQKALKEYMDSLEEGKYNFEGTPFSNLADAKQKILTAIDALNTPEESDDFPAFNALGLKYRTYFSNGGNDPSGYVDTAGNPLTYSLYSEYQKKLQDAKTKAEFEKLKAQLANYWKGFRSHNFSNLNGRPLTSLESNIEYLNLLFSKDKFTGDEASQIVSAFKLAEKNGQLIPLSKEEIAKLNPSIFGGNRVRYLRKINGMTAPLYYDTLTKLFKQFHGDTPQTSFLDILNLNNPETITKKKADSNLKLRDLDAQRTEINENDVLYLSSLIPDIASLFNEEPISAGIMGVTAAGIRNAALANRPGGMSTEDKLWQALDYAGGAFSSIPFFGDAYVLGRILNTARKGATALLGMAGIVGVSSDIYNLIKKFNNDETLTAREKIALASSIPLIINAYRSGRAWKQNKTIKAINEGEKTKQGTIEATNGSIKGIKEETAKDLQKEFKKAGNDNAKKQEILKNNEEVVKLAKEQNVKIEDLLFESHLMNGKHSPFKKLQDIEIRDVPTGNPVYRQNYLKYLEELELGNFWLRNKARGLKENDWFYNATGGSRNTPNKGNWFTRAWNSTFGSNKTYDRIVNSSETPTSKPSTETPKTTGKRTWAEIEKEPKKWSQSTEAKEYKEMLKGNYSNNAIQGGTHKIGDLTINVDIPRPGATNGFAEITFKNGNVQTLRFDNLKLLQELIAKIVKERRVQVDSSGKKTKVDAKEIGKILKSLKARGFLKQGGQINPSLDTMIEDFFKNNKL